MEIPKIKIDKFQAIATVMIRDYTDNPVELFPYTGDCDELLTALRNVETLDNLGDMFPYEFFINRNEEELFNIQLEAHLITPGEYNGFDNADELVNYIKEKIKDVKERA